MRSNVFVRMPVRVINYRHLVSLLSICARIIENVSALHICFYACGLFLCCFFLLPYRGLFLPYDRGNSYKDKKILATFGGDPGGIPDLDTVRSE